MRRFIGLSLMLLALGLMAPVVSASSYFVAEASGVPEDIDHISTDSGDTGLIVTEDGISLVESSDGVGLASGGKYWFGDQGDPTETFAFTVTHQIEDNPPLTIRFDGANIIENEVDNIVFTVFDAQGDFIGIVSENEQELTFNGGPKGSVYYVVVMIDTHELTPEDDIHGVFSVTT